MCGMKSMPPTCISCSPGCPIHRPRGRTGSAFPGPGRGVQEGEGRTHPSRPSALGIQGLTHDRPRLRPARPARATGLEGTTGSCSDTLVRREVTLEKLLHECRGQQLTLRSMCSWLWARCSPPWHAIPRGPDHPLCCGLTAFMVRSTWASEAESTLTSVGRGGVGR